MSTEPMELAKNWDPKHAAKVLPGYAQIKYDGVPLTFLRLAKDTMYEIVGQKPNVPKTLFLGGTVVALTRQNEVAVSVPHLLVFADKLLLTQGASFTAECLVPGSPFKDSSGIIRRTTPDEDTAKIIAIAFDFNVLALPNETYYIRAKQFEEVYHPLVVQYKIINAVCKVFLVKSVSVQDVDDVARVLGEFQERIADLEGMMIHSYVKPFRPGKRCWGMSRVKPQPTIDLEVVSFEEAISEAGEPLGMVGRVNVRLRRKWPSGTLPAGWTPVEGVYCTAHYVGEKVVGVGPGKLNHDERKSIWYSLQKHGGDMKSAFGPLYAEIKYMPDESYEALRQPTVQRLRTDKTEGDILEY